MSVKGIFKVILALEPLVLVAITIAFWFPSPIRDRWVWLLLCYLPILVARTVIYRRALTRTPLDLFLLAFFLLGILNIYVANTSGVTNPPFTRGFIMLARPALGVMIYYSLVDAAYRKSSMDGPLAVVILMSLLLGVLGLTATQWNEKTLAFDFIVTRLPRLTGLPLPKDAGLSFNANEIAGAIAYLVPITAAIAVYRWRMKLTRIGVTLAFTMLFFALFLGQSRLAIAGVLLALAGVIYWLIPRGKWRMVAWVALACVTLLEVAVITNPANREQLADRDEGSFIGRLDIWTSGFEIVADYPLTGVGMSMFRDSRVRERYPVPRYENRILPHTHNEMLQIATDLGVPGLLVFIGLHVVAAYMLFQIWMHGDEHARVVSIGTGAGLVAHMVFGLGDAIPLWDRFAFLYWFMLGLAGAQYAIMMQQNKFGG